MAGISRFSRLHHNTQQAGSMYHDGHPDMETLDARETTKRRVLHSCPKSICTPCGTRAEESPLVNVPRAVDPLRTPSDEDRERSRNEKCPVKE